MTYRQRIVADRYLAAPVALLLNLASRLLGFVLRRDHSIHPAAVRNILVAKLVGMGSAIQATPLLRALRLRFPNARLIFVTLRANRALVERMEGVDDVLCIDDRTLWRMAWSTVRAVVTMIRMRADLYFDLELYSSFASLLALSALTRNRVGFCRQSTRFKKGIYTHLVYFNTHRAIRTLYLQMGRAVGTSALPDDSIGRLRVDDTDRTAVCRKLAALEDGWTTSTPYVIINPNASELLLERRWPAAHVREAIERLTSEGHRIVLIGAASERAYVRSVIDGLSPRAHRYVADTSGKLTIGELLAVLENARCVVTNDTGPMHMAIAMQRPTVCLFGPVSPDHYGHPGQNVETLYAPVYCSPCVHEIEAPPCYGANLCMQRIDPAAVVAAVERLIGGSHDSVKSDPLPLVTEFADGRPLGVIVAHVCPRQGFERMTGKAFGSV